jgi:hypothetical protein
MVEIYFLYFFSYWIFIWFLVYELGGTNYNPYVWLVLGFLVNLFILLLMVYYRNNWLNIFVFTVLNLIVKGIPILVLWNYRFRWMDVYAGLSLLGVYLIYLGWNDKLFGSRNVYRVLFETIKKNRPIPFMVFVGKWFRS